MAAGPRHVLGDMRQRVGRMQKDLEVNKHALGHAPAFESPDTLTLDELSELERLHSEAVAKLDELAERLGEFREDMPPGTAEEILAATEAKDPMVEAPF